MTINEFIEMLIAFRDRTRYGEQPIIFKVASPDESKSDRQQAFTSEDTDIYISPQTVIDYHGNHARVLGYKCRGIASKNESVEGSSKEVILLK